MLSEMPKAIKVPKWVLPFGYGLTLYKLILVRKDGDIPYLVAHESKHVEQWTRIGFFKFPYLYIKEYIAKGYWENKYEVEARYYGRMNRDKYKDYVL